MEPEKFKTLLALEAELLGRDMKQTLLNSESFSSTERLMVNMVIVAMMKNFKQMTLPQLKESSESLTKMLSSIEKGEFPPEAKAKMESLRPEYEKKGMSKFLPFNKIETTFKTLKDNPLIVNSLRLTKYHIDRVIWKVETESMKTESVHK